MMANPWNVKALLVVGGLSLVLVSSAAGAPPAVSTDLERLGMRLYKDRNLSFNGTQSCQTCHHPISGFADPRNAHAPETSVVSVGADGVSLGGRNAPSAAYAGYSPQLALTNGEWVGGLFWDGRASGSLLGDPLAEQAFGPPLNPVEMAMEDEAAVVAVIRQAEYRRLWVRAFGAASLESVEAAFTMFGVAVAAYERSADLTRFRSRYDLARDAFEPAEIRGLALFETHCAGCHSTEPSFGAVAPLFTNYHYANLGVPPNPLLISSQPDLGLGAVVGDEGHDGKFKVPTLRNVAKTAPYSHNGRFATLREMVEFVNDRSGYEAEVPRNVATSVGSLGLDDNDVDDLVSFLRTLDDE